MIALLIALPVLAGGLYWRLGSPGRPAAPFAERAEERRQLAAAEARRQEALPSVGAMIARLEEQLEANPDDLQSWLRLGRAYALARQFERAADDVPAGDGAPRGRCGAAFRARRSAGHGRLTAS